MGNKCLVFAARLCYCRYVAGPRARRRYEDLISVAQIFQHFCPHLAPAGALGESFLGLRPACRARVGRRRWACMEDGDLRPSPTPNRGRPSTARSASPLTASTRPAAVCDDPSTHPPSPPARPPHPTPVAAAAQGRQHEVLGVERGGAAAARGRTRRRRRLDAPAVDTFTSVCRGADEATRYAIRLPSALYPTYLPSALIFVRRDVRRAVRCVPSSLSPNKDSTHHHCRPFPPFPGSKILRLSSATQGHTLAHASSWRHQTTMSHASATRHRNRPGV